MITRTGKSKTSGRVSAKTTDTGKGGAQSAEATSGPEYHAGGKSTESKGSPLDINDLMPKLEQIDRKLKYDEEGREELKREIKHNKNKT